MPRSQVPVREIQPGLYETEAVGALSKIEPATALKLLHVQLVTTSGKELRIPLMAEAVRELREALKSFPEFPDPHPIG
jgi:hypothetical protein